MRLEMSNKSSTRLYLCSALESCWIIYEKSADYATIYARTIIFNGKSNNWLRPVRRQFAALSCGTIIEMCTQLTRQIESQAQENALK